MFSAKNLFIILIVSILFTTALWAVFTIFITGRMTKEYQLQIDDLNRQFDELAMVADSYDEFKVSFDQRIADFDTLRTVIPNNQAYANALEEIRLVAEIEKLQVMAFQPMLNDAYPALYVNQKMFTNHVECYPVQIKLYGDFLTIGSFVEKLLATDHLVNIAKMSIESEMQEGGALMCNITLYTYIYVSA